MFIGHITIVVGQNPPWWASILAIKPAQRWLRNMKVTGSHCPKWWLILDASALQEDTERLHMYIYIYSLYSWVVHKPFTANILVYWNMMKTCRNGHYTPQFLTCKPALYLSLYLYSMKQIKRESKREQLQQPPLSHREQINNSHPCWTNFPFI